MISNQKFIAERVLLFRTLALLVTWYINIGILQT